MKYMKLKSDGHLYAWTEVLAADTERFEEVNVNLSNAFPDPEPAITPEDDPVTEDAGSFVIPVTPPPTAGNGAVVDVLDLGQLSRPQLLAHAKGCGVTISRTMTNSELVAAIRAMEAPADAGE